MSDNIKVAIRVRPLIKREKEEQLPVQWVVKNNGITQIDPETKKLNETQFNFDYIFDVINNNDDVFNLTAKPIIEAAMKGINGTIFTYGQTGSGKTYTMLGSKTEKGVIGLTVDHIFNFIGNDVSRNYLLRVSYIEIYNEKINDLLDKNRTDLKVKEDVHGHITVDCKEEVASSPDDIFHAMKRGEKLKRTGETNMNERSSRSHTIFRITVESCNKNDSENAQMEAQLNLIDLAGSERARLTGATGERFNEGRHINLSLSTLSLVIKQLSESSNSKFVNYRDSKLTRILQPSLGGNALTTIICTVTPAALEETQCTLDFAVRAKGVKNKPQINEEISDKALLKKVLRQVSKLQNELNSKNSQIEEAKKRENNREEVLKARINNLWASMASAPYRSETRRRRTWAGGQSDKISLNKSHNNFILPTIIETVEKHSDSQHEKNIIDLDLNNDTFKIELPDFELQLLKDQKEKCRFSTISDDGYLSNCLTIRENQFIDASDAPDEDGFDPELTPEKHLQVPQENCVCKKSPGTPKVILRKKLEELQTEFTTLREFTTLEKLASQENLLKPDPSKKLDDIEYMKKSLEDSELLCLDLNKKCSKLQSEHTVLLSNHEELKNKYEQLYQENQSLISIRDKFMSVESEKNEYKNKMNEVLKKLTNLQDEAASHECEMELLKEKHKNREKELEFSLNLAWNDFITSEEKQKLTDIVHLQFVNDELQKKLSSSQDLSSEMYEKKIRELEEIIVNKVAENEMEINRNLELTQKLEELSNNLKISESMVNELKANIEKLELELEVKVAENLELKTRTEETDSIIDKVSTTIDSEEFHPALSEGGLSRNNSHNDLLDNDSKSVTGQNQAELLKNLVEEQKSEIVRLEKLLEEKTNNFSSEVKTFEEKLNHAQMLSDKLKEQLSAMQSEKTLYEGEKTSFQSIIKDKDEKLRNLNKLETQLNFVTAEKESHEQIITELRKQINEKILELEEMHSHNYDGEIKNLNNYITEMQSFVKNVTEENDNLKEEIEEISISLKRIEEEKKLLIDELEESKKQFIDAANVKEATELQNLLKILQDENEDLKKEVEKTNISLKNLEDKNQSLISNLESLKQQTSKTVSVKETTQAVNNHNSTLNDSKCRSRISDVKPSRIPRLSNGLANNKGKIDQSSIQDSAELESSSIFANGSYFEHMSDVSVTPSDIIDSILLQNSSVNQSNINNITGYDSKFEMDESNNSFNFTYADIVDNLSNKDIEELKTIILELYNIKNALLRANEKLRNDLQCKTRETDEIKNDVGALKSGMQQLEETVYSLTNENADMGKKLAEAKTCVDQSESVFKKLEQDLMIKIKNLEDEKQSQEKGIVELKEKIAKMENIKSNVECEELKKLNELIKEYEEKIDDLTKENENLSSDLMEKIEELENIRISKSLQYDHECKYREKVDYFIEKNSILERENAGLSNNLIERLEEIEILTKALKNNVSLEIQKEVEDQVEQSKLLDNSFREKTNDSNISIEKNIQNNSNTSANLEKSIHDIIIQYDENEILRQNIRKLENEIKELKELNAKLSNMQLTSCKQCVHLTELNETRRILKNEIKIVNKRLQSIQDKFNHDCENEERLRNKAAEDINTSKNNSSFNESYFEGVEEIAAEEQVQRLQTDLESLQERYKSLSTSYKDKCDELNKYHDDNLLESSLTLTPERVNKTKQNSKLEKLQISLNKYKNEHQQLSKDLNRIDNVLKKMQNKKISLENEVECLKTEKELLEKKLENVEDHADKTQEEIEILLKKIQDLKEQLNQVNVDNKGLYELKTVLEKQIENYKNENETNNEKINDLIQSLAELKRSNDSLKVELEALKLSGKEESVELQKYKQNVANLEAQVQELTNSLKYSEDKKNIIIEELAVIKSKPLADPEEVTLLTDKLEKYKIQVESLELSIKDLREKLSHYAKENFDLANEISKLQSENKIDLNETDTRMEVCDESFSKGSKELASEELDALRKTIMKELQALGTDLDCSKLDQQNVSDVFCIFVKTLLTKEQEMVKTLHRRFDREKNKIEEDKKQLLDAEKRVSTWAKELEAEIERLQTDLSKEEAKCATLRTQIQTLENSILDYEHEKQLMKEKMNIMESDFNALQNDLEKNSKTKDSHITLQDKEKLIQDVTEKCKVEFQIKLNETEKEYKRRIEELTSDLEHMKTKNKDLMSNLEGLEINERQLKSILDMKTNELNKVNSTLQRLQKDLENLNESYNQLNEDNQAKNCKITEITGLLKVKCDKMSEYKTKLETMIPEYDALKEQAEERQLRLEKYRSEVENLTNENMKQMAALKDELDTEKIKSTSLIKQINDITNRNTVIQVELEMLKQKCDELQQSNDKLVKKMRNSTSKLSVERDMEDLKDTNRTLSNKLDGASNRITELQKNKAELLKDFVDLQGQYNLCCQENNSLKITLENYKTKFTSPDALDYRFKYDTLVQEKNKIALELENKRFVVIQLEEKVVQLTNENETLRVQNKDLDEEMDDMLKKIRELEDDNDSLLREVFEMRDKEEMRNKIEEKSEIKNNSNHSRNNSPIPSSRSKQRRSDLYNQNRPLLNVEETENIKETCECENLRKKMITLEQDLVLKNAKIDSLKLQLECNSYPYQQECVRLGEALRSYKTKIQQLDNELTSIKTKPLDCERCKNWKCNQRDVSIQTDKEKLTVWMNGTHTSGLVEEYNKETEQDNIIKKLRKEKEILKKLSLSRLEQIKEYKIKVKDLEEDNTELKTRLSSTRHQRSSIQDNSMKENVPSNVLGQSQMIPHRYWFNNNV